MEKSMAVRKKARHGDRPEDHHLSAAVILAKTKKDNKFSALGDGVEALSPSQTSKAEGVPKEGLVFSTALYRRPQVVSERRACQKQQIGLGKGGIM